MNSIITVLLATLFLSSGANAQDYNTEAISENIDIRCSANSTGQTITSGGSPQVVDYSTCSMDPFASVTTGSSWKFTAPLPGLYLVHASIRFANAGTSWTAGTQAILRLSKNGTSFSDAAKTQVNTHNGYVEVVLTDVVDLIKGDYIDLRAYQDTGASRDLQSNSSLHNRVTITRISNNN